MWSDEDTKDYLGKTIASFQWNKEQLQFEFTDGSRLIGTAWGDCCSITWIESIDLPQVIEGVLVNIEDIKMPSQDYDHEKYECLQFYGLRIITSKGIAVVDYRNSSNGYYGGDICWS